MKAIEQYFHVVLFIMLYKVGLTFKSVDETLVCDHSNESYWAALSCGTVHYAVQGNRMCDHSMKAMEFWGVETVEVQEYKPCKLLILAEHNVKGTVLLNDTRTVSFSKWSTVSTSSFFPTKQNKQWNNNQKAIFSKSSV